MSVHNIPVEAGKTRVLHTSGKYCDRDIVVTAKGGNVDDRYAEGVEDGKQAEHDAFWDSYQQNGNRLNYEYGFTGQGWTDETFKPKYDIAPTYGGNIFSNTAITDLVQLLDAMGVRLDFSNVRDTAYIALNASLTTFPTADCRNRTHMNYIFNNCANLRSVEKVILKSDGSQAFSANSFKDLSALEEIRFEGCIGKNFEIKDSPLLSDASVQSIIDCLKDLTGATAQTLTLHATVGGNMTAEQKAAITAKNWTLVY